MRGRSSSKTARLPPPGTLYPRFAPVCTRKGENIYYILVYSLIYSNSLYCLIYCFTLCAQTRAFARGTCPRDVYAILVERG